MALIFADCCRENKINSQIENGLQTNCSFYPTEPLYSTQQPLGQPIPVEFNNVTGSGIQLEKYFQDKLNAKGKDLFPSFFYFSTFFHSESVRSEREICRATREEVMPRKEVETCSDVESVQEAKEAGCSAKGTPLSTPTPTLFILSIMISWSRY